MPRLLFVIFLYCFSAPAIAKRLAVLDFESANIEQELLLLLAEMVRNEATVHLKDEGVTIIDKANMLMLLRENGKDPSCIAGACEIDLGRSIGANYIVTGMLNKMDDEWILSLSLYDTDTGGKLMGKTIERDSRKALRKVHRIRKPTICFRFKDTVCN